jgi:hypothetical protein
MQNSRIGLEVVGKGRITAQVVEDSINKKGVRLTTLQLTYPRFILAELNTHRVFSRSTSSSRAIPTSKMIDQVYHSPAMPVHWGRNQKGMQAKEELDEFERRQAVSCWLGASKRATEHARLMSGTGVHKQVVNRILEPFLFAKTVITGTDWDNFFELRYHEDSDPNFFELARVIYTARDRSVPKLLKPGEWHVPYITDSERISLTLLEQVKTSSARCCRVSYLKHDGSFSTLKEDFELHDRLVGAVPRHSSPCEHQATPKGLFTFRKYSGNFDSSWVQYRKLIERRKVDNFLGWK